MGGVAQGPDLSVPYCGRSQSLLLRLSPLRPQGLKALERSLVTAPINRGPDGLRGWRTHRAFCIVCDSGSPALGAGGKIMRVVEAGTMALARPRGILHLHAAHPDASGYAPPAERMGIVLATWR